jgi:hypothetical protein
MTCGSCGGPRQVRCAAVISADAAAAPTESRFSGALPEVFIVPSRNPNFTGRAAEAETTRTHLGAGTAMTAQVVRGLGGVGKTQTMIEYTHRYAPPPTTWGG